MLLELDPGFFGVYVHAQQDCSYWHEDIKSRSTLLITVGDSWTWGDSLGSSNFGLSISDPDRTNLVYGRHLQGLIGDCDWINIAMPGTANQWIVDVAQRFVGISRQVSYSRIFLCIGLTDIFRDVSNAKIQQKSLQEVTCQYERTLFEKIQEIESESTITVIVGRNFTDTVFDSHRDQIKHHLPDRWVDVSADKSGMTRPRKCWGVLVPEVLLPQEKQWALDNLMPDGNAMIDFLMACPLHYKKSSKHPTEDCHRFWAEYIHSYMQHHQMVDQ
jgi:hypothetical protein